MSRSSVAPLRYTRFMPPFAVEYAIEPNESVGPIRFGMLAEEVREQLRSLPQSTQGSDAFEDLGIRVHYGPREGVEAVEFTGPARPTLQGRPLLGKPHADMEAWIAEMDPAFKREHSGLTSIRLGLRLYAPSARNQPEVPVESVTVFNPDYARRYIASIWPPAL